MSKTNYAEYRGKCKELSEALCHQDKSLTLVRGFYHCPMWGKQHHWWVKDSNGNIIDPTIKQFPTEGIAAEYEEFNGVCECDQCGKEFNETDGKFESNYAFCSGECLCKFVGL